MAKATTRHQGTVRRYFPEKGYGFLEGDGGGLSDVFFHRDEWGASIAPEAGVRVSFAVLVKPRGLRAVDLGDVDELVYDE